MPQADTHMESYREFVTAQSERNPSLKLLRRFLADNTSHRYKFDIVVLDFTDDGPKFQSVHTVEKLDIVLRDSWSNPGDIHGRMLIIQDLTSDLVEILGSLLNVDPIFFAAHLHSPWPDITMQTPEMALLPSRQKTSHYINMHYHRIIQFDDLEIPTRKLFRNTNVYRKVVVLPQTKSVRLGLAQHCCSVFKSQNEGKFWTCVILADPPIGEFYHATGGSDRSPVTYKLPSSLFLGGYEDFLTPPCMYDSLSYQSGPERSAILDDLVHYWCQEIPHIFNTQRPSLLSLSYYPLKIVAAEWVNYLTVMQHSIKQYEYTIDDLPKLVEQIEKIDSDLRALQSWRRRSMSSHRKMASVARFIRDSCASIQDESCLSLAEDYEHLARSVDDFGHRFESTIPVVTSMVQIADSRQSFAETLNVSRLTYLALVFVPLAFTASVFSMNDHYAPGGPRFWVYVLVAIPMTFLVFVIARPPYKEIQVLRDYMKLWRGIRLPR